MPGRMNNWRILPIRCTTLLQVPKGGLTTTTACSPGQYIVGIAGSSGTQQLAASLECTTPTWNLPLGNFGLPFDLQGTLLMRCSFCAARLEQKARK